MTRPAVDIILPFHGQYEAVTRCVSSVFACTPNQEYKIILVDDASPNKDYIQALSKHRGRVVGCRLGEQLGFGGALEVGFGRSDAPLVAFLHSDVWVDGVNWLANLQRALGRLKGEGVKLVSARSDGPGTAACYDPRMFGPPEDDFGDVIADAACPLMCALCHRELFHRIGGFVRPYPYAWYEDEELFWRMKHYGFKQAVVSGSYARHAGGLTIGSLWRSNPRIRPIMESNRSRCIEDLSRFPKKQRR